MSIRVNQNQINTIKRLALELFNSNDVWIFGSRADLNQKGGDIDIYLFTDKKDDILKYKIIFLREFEKEFGEQKVDLLVDNSTIQKDIFDIARAEGVKL